MFTTAVTAFAVSLFTFLVLAIMTRQERRRGRRFFAAAVREWLDMIVERVANWWGRSWDHFAKYWVQLNWYYGIHGLLRAFLRGIVKIYTYFENMFERNRVRAKQLRKEKREIDELNHLRQMAVHKEETALTPAQQRKLRKKQLEGKF